MNEKILKIREIKVQFLKFCATGIVNTLIDFSILNLLIFLIGLGNPLNYSIFKAISFLGGATNSFFWNKNWVFKKKDDTQKRKREVVSFFAVSTTGLLLNTSIATFAFLLITNHFPDVPEIFSANVSALAGLTILVFWDFLGYKYIVFKK